MRITVEQATTLFIKLAKENGIDPATIDREAIATQFAEVFERKSQEQIDATFFGAITATPASGSPGAPSPEK